MLSSFHSAPTWWPVDDDQRIGIRIVLVGPPITGSGESLAAYDNALDYIDRWEHHLRFDAIHQRYWGWLYRLLLAGDDDHIRATLLDQPI